METKQKTFWQYYSLILREAIGKAWNLIGAGGTVLGIVVSIGASIIYTKPTTLQEIGLNEAIIAAIIFIGLGIVLSAFYVLVQPVIYNNQQIQKVIDLNEELNSVKPKIQLLDQPTINLVLMKQDDWEDYALIAVVPFVNNPDHPTSKNNAANIRAEIQYLNEKREKLLPHWIQGRWTNSPEPSQLERGSHQQLESTDFPNNGAMRWLDLIMRYPGDGGGFYAYNNDSYKFLQFRPPQFFMEEDRIIIQVNLKGSYVQETFEFLVISEKSNIVLGKAGAFSIARI